MRLSWSAIDAKRDTLVALRRERPRAATALDVWRRVDETYCSLAVCGNSLTFHEVAATICMQNAGKSMTDTATMLSKLRQNP